MNWHNIFAKFLANRALAGANLNSVFPETVNFLLLRAIAFRPEKTLVVFPDATSAEKFADTLNELCQVAQLPEKKCVFIPESGRGKLLFPGGEARRARALDTILNGNFEVAVGSIHALSGPAPRPETSLDSRLELKVGMTLPPQELLEKLVALDYDDEYETTVSGEFSRRGGIIDLFSPAHDFPCRIEYFGDEIDSLRSFSPQTQRSTGKLDSYRIIGRAGITAGGAAESDGFEYFEPLNCHVIVVFPQSATDKLRGFAAAGVAEKFAARCEQWEKNQQITWFRDSAEGAAAPDDPEADLLPLDWEAPELEDQLHAVNWRRELLKSRISNAQSALIFTDSPASLVGVKKWVKKQNFLGANLEFAALPLRYGFELPSASFIAVSEKNLVDCGYVRPVASGGAATAPPPELDIPSPVKTEFSLAELDEGEYAVHLDHGIGIFRGFKLLETNGIQREVIVMEYRNDQLLYVPLLAAHKLSRYLGSAGKVKLHTLGSAKWKRDCENAGRGVRSYAADTLRLQAMRQALPGFACPEDPVAQKLFRQEFPYQDTPDQFRSDLEIQRDMGASKPMDRLLCGDVGYGKTELAMRAAFRAVSAGFQVAVIAPTTVLAQQHFASFKERFAKYPFNIEVLSRFRSAGEQAHIFYALPRGGIDILIGTHRICSSQVKFRNLGLVVIDEEQRFGADLKDRLRRFRAESDVLSMSATPIPRTLYLAMAGARDLSTLMTAPKQRVPVKTVIAPEEKHLVAEAISQELARGGQVYYLHNRVKSIDEKARQIREMVPQARVAVAHGQMPESELETVMNQFQKGEVDCLICSTIIESGLDVPNANTIIIERADRFGLGELYQLRGRVGRWKNQAYAYMLLPRNMLIGSDARKRLAAIRRCSNLGAGFQLALRDLEIRGSGNILGTQQSGHMDAIGFDLYCHLLQMEVAKLKGEKLVFYPEVEIGIDFIAYSLQDPPGGLAACFPRNYIPGDRLRLEAYRRLAQLHTEEEVADFKAEIADRFGKLPKPTQTLFQVTLCRVRAGLAGYSRIYVVNGRISMNNVGGEIYRLPDGKAPQIDYRDAPELRMQHLMRILKQACERKKC